MFCTICLKILHSFRSFLKMFAYLKEKIKKRYECHVFGTFVYNFLLVFCLITFFFYVLKTFTYFKEFSENFCLLLGNFLKNYILIGVFLYFICLFFFCLIKIVKNCLHTFSKLRPNWHTCRSLPLKH